jgi:ABC-type polysaccharide/polyol phosphate transport system ATPase subunit
MNSNDSVNSCLASLHVKNLKYVPSRNVFASLENEIRQNMFQCCPSMLSALPQHKSNVIASPLYDVSFTARAGEITAIMSNNPAERKTLIDLIVCRRYMGEFDGEIFLEGKFSSFVYLNNMAFVPRVSICYLLQVSLFHGIPF